jgi:hypothetical protein
MEDVCSPETLAYSQNNTTKQPRRPIYTFISFKYWFLKLLHVIWLLTQISGLLKMVVVWDVSPCSLVDTDRRIILMTEAVRSSETSVNMYQNTGCNIPEDSHLHTRRGENLKSPYSGLLFETQLHDTTRMRTKHSSSHFPASTVTKLSPEQLYRKKILKLYRN